MKKVFNFNFFFYLANLLFTICKEKMNINK